MLTKFFQAILVVFLSISAVFVVAILIILFPQIIKIVNETQLTIDKQVIQTLVNLVVVITFILIVITFFSTVLYLANLLFKILVWQIFNKKFYKIIEKSKRIDVEATNLNELREQVNSKMNQLEFYVNLTNDKLNVMRKSIKKTLMRLEKDINSAIDYLLKQLKDYLPELLAFFQVSFCNFVKELMNTSPYIKLIDFFSYVVIFIIAVLLKNPNTIFYKSRTLQSIGLSILTISQGIIIFSYHTIANPDIIINCFFMCSFLLYVWILAKSMKNSNRYINKIKIPINQI